MLLICFPPKESDVEQLFTCFLAICISSSENVFLNPLLYVLTRISFTILTTMHLLMQMKYISTILKNKIKFLVVNEVTR